MRKNVIRHYEVSIIQRFGYGRLYSVKLRSVMFLFGEAAIRLNDVSAKQRFGEITLRESDVASYVMH